MKLTLFWFEMFAFFLQFPHFSTLLGGGRSALLYLPSSFLPLPLVLSEIGRISHFRSHHIYTPPGHEEAFGLSALKHQILKRHGKPDGRCALDRSDQQTNT